MSKATKQAFTILVAIGGCVKAVRNDREIGPELLGKVQEAERCCRKILNWWPLTGDTMKHGAAALSGIGNWNQKLRGIPEHEGKWSITFCASVAIQLLTDLYERTQDKTKKEQLDTLFPCLQEIYDLVDACGVAWPDYELATKITNILYQEIGF